MEGARALRRGKQDHHRASREYRAHGQIDPDGSDYDREIVIVSTLRMSRIRLIDEGRQVVCHPGATLFQLKKGLKPLGREPHSVIRSSYIGASVVGGSAIIRGAR
jgi:D-lactate dehydrogenase